MQFSVSVHMMGLALIYRQEEGGCGCGGCEAATEEHPLFGQMYALVAQRLCPKVRAEALPAPRAGIVLAGHPRSSAEGDLSIYPELSSIPRGVHGCQVTGGCLH